MEIKITSINVSIARKCQVYAGLLLWRIVIIFYLQANATWTCWIWQPFLYSEEFLSWSYTWRHRSDFFKNFFIGHTHEDVNQLFSRISQWVIHEDIDQIFSRICQLVIHMRISTRFFQEFVSWSYTWGRKLINFFPRIQEFLSWSYTWGHWSFFSRILSA